VCRRRRLGDGPQLHRLRPAQRTGRPACLYEGVPNYPNPERWWSIVERHKVDILYTAPTAIRSHMKWGPEWAEKHDLSSLRLLGSVGEPINPEAWVWYREHIGG
jgi:acetyl-CoA synthetase